MKIYLFLLYFLAAYAFVSAQEYIPLHLNYDPTIVYTREKKVKIEDVSFVAVNKNITASDLYNNKVDSIPFETQKAIAKKYNLLRVSRYAYRKSKKGNPLFETESRIWAGYPYDYLKIHKNNIPYWLSVHREGYSNYYKAIGIIEKDKNKFKIWNKKTAIKRLTPIETAKEALFFLYLMERVYPTDNFDELCEENEEGYSNYQICTETITPTIVKEEKDHFVINLFNYNMLDGSLFEITYQLYKNGKYKILSKKRIYINKNENSDGLSY